MTGFFNTIQETGSTLSQSHAKAVSQQERILDFFKRHPGRHFTPAEVAKETGILLTSVRRAMTDLADAGQIVKTEMLTPGIYGKNNFNWRLNVDRRHEQRRLFA